MLGIEDRFTPPARFTDASDLLHEQVARHLGTDDFGPDDYLPGLRVLLMSMDYDPHFTERGRRIAWGSIAGTLVARGLARRAMKERPGFDSHPISKPVVITGIPRTGTTALHKLMAVDPQFQGLQGWLISAPIPRPPRAEWDRNPLFVDAVERVKLRHAATPSLRAAHNIAAEEVDECLGILRQGFVSNIWTCGWSSATYDLWWQTQSERPAYELLYRTYQLIGSNEPDKRWLLKNPGHIDSLDHLFAVFPDAMVIQTHRDPARAIPSVCSILIKNHPMMEEGRQDMRARLMGLRETEKWSNALRKAEPVRLARSGQILDVIHADFHGDPMGMIRRIYDFFGLELTPGVIAAMERRIEEAPEAAHGAHLYDLSEFGLTRDYVWDRFGDYMDQFDLRSSRQ